MFVGINLVDLEYYLMVIIMKDIKRDIIFRILFIVLILGIIFGLLFISIVSDSNKNIIKDSVNNYFIYYNEFKLEYLKIFFDGFISNIIVILFLWIIGLSVVGSFINIFILLYKSFLCGFSFVSIVYTFGVSGLFKGSVFIISEFLNLLILFLLVYYSLSFSIILFNYLFKKKEFNRNIVVVRYSKILGFCFVLCIINNLINTFLISNIIKWL